MAARNLAVYQSQRFLETVPEGDVRGPVERLQPPLHMGDVLAQAAHRVAGTPAKLIPLVLSLEPMPPSGVGALNHLGFRMPDSAALVAMQERLERAGIRSRREEGVECCYARQTKFWVTDPDQTLWEMYTLDEDIDHRGDGQTREEMLGESNPSAGTSWEHYLGLPVPESIPLADASVEEVRLRGTFNAPLADDVKRRLLREVARVLRPGGILLSGFSNPALYIFDDAVAERGELVVRHAVPYSDIDSLSEEERCRYTDAGQPLVYGHTLEDQIGGQLDAGFLLTGFFEDRDPSHPLSKFLPAFAATRTRSNLLWVTNSFAKAKRMSCT